jgi:hypothetical protein
MSRAMLSGPQPGAQPITISTGRSGFQSCAGADNETATKDKAMRRSTLRKEKTAFMTPPGIR